MRRGHDGNAHGQAGREQMIQRTNGGILPGFVGIETQHHFIHVAFDNARMLVGERRALRRNDVLHASHEARDQIKLPFANDGEPGVENRALGFVEAEENLALGENRRLRRVDVFRRLFVAGQNPSAESQSPCPARRKSETSAARESGRKTCPSPPCAKSVRPFQPAPVRNSCSCAQFTVSSHASGAAPSRNRFNRLGGDAALFQIITRQLSGGFVGQRVLPALRNLVVNLKQAGPSDGAIAVRRDYCQIRAEFSRVRPAGARRPRSRCSRIP